MKTLILHEVKFLDDIPFRKRKACCPHVELKRKGIALKRNESGLSRRSFSEGGRKSQTKYYELGVTK